MGRILGRSHSTITAELARKPRYELVYRAEWAELDYRRKQENKGNIRKLDKDPKLREAVIEGLLTDKSPEQISNRIRLVGASLGVGENTVSHETIYSFVYSDSEAKEKKLYQHLRRSRKYRRKTVGRRSREKEKTAIKERTSIHERPECVNQRRDFGHFETDSVLFSK